MEVVFSKRATADIHYWKKINNKSIQKKISELIQDILKSPFTGIGKPELLKHELSGYWSRRISSEHRLVYKIENNQLVIASCRYHY